MVVGEGKGRLGEEVEEGRVEELGEDCVWVEVSVILKGSAPKRDPPRVGGREGEVDENVGHAGVRLPTGTSSGLTSRKSPSAASRRVPRPLPSRPGPPLPAPSMPRRSARCMRAKDDDPSSPPSPTSVSALPSAASKN